MFAVLATADTAAKAGLAETFGLHTPFFIAQVVNFLLVIFVLKKFAFGPIQQMLEQRRQRIAEGEAKLQRIEQQLAESEKTTAAAIAKANEEALRLIQEAKEGSHAFSEQKAQEAISQAQQILAKAEAAAQADRQRMEAELKRDFGRLVVAATRQAAGRTLTEEDQKRINEEALASIGS